jgi:hypothetical protein
MTIEKELYSVMMREYDRLQVAGSGKEFHMNISVNVPSYGDSAMTITYGIGSYSDQDQAKGANIHDVVTEYMRRKNWTEANRPMVLIGSNKLEDDDQPIVEPQLANDE